MEQDDRVLQQELFRERNAHGQAKTRVTELETENATLKKDLLQAQKEVENATKEITKLVNQNAKLMKKKAVDDKKAAAKQAKEEKKRGKKGSPKTTPRSPRSPQTTSPRGSNTDTDADEPVEALAPAIPTTAPEKPKQSGTWQDDTANSDATDTALGASGGGWARAAPKEKTGVEVKAAGTGMPRRPSRPASSDPSKKPAFPPPKRPASADGVTPVPTISHGPSPLSVSKSKGDEDDDDDSDDDDFDEVDDDHDKDGNLKPGHAPIVSGRPAPPGGSRLGRPPAPVPLAATGSGPVFRNRPAPPTTGGIAGAILKIPNLDRSASEMSDIPEEILNKEYLTKLVVAQNKIKTIPDNFAEKLPLLEYLDVSFNQLTTLPDCLCALANVHTLSLAGNRLTNLLPSSPSVPSESTLMGLASLGSIDLSSNRLTEFPSPLMVLPALGTIVLRRNDLHSLPGDFAELAAVPFLVHLDLATNHLKTLPASLGTLVCLEYLDLSDNGFSLLPNEIENLTALRTLKVSDNELTALPAGLGYAPLEVLLADHNRITALPETLFLETASQTLTQIVMKENCLTHISDNIGNLVSLSSLDLSANQIEGAVPAGIESLQELLILRLALNKITSLPDEICNLTYLQNLNVACNQLTALPSNLNSMTSLQHLFIAYNHISSLPDLTGMADLYEIYLNGNPITSLPESLWDLEALANLHLGEVKLDVPVSEDQLDRLSSTLEKIDLSNNHLTTMPPVSVCTLLTNINISNNELTECAIEGVCDFLQLSEIDVSSNHISSFPDEAYARAHDENGVHIVVDFNPVDQIKGLEEVRPPFRVGKRYRLGQGEMIGRRPGMEDAFSIVGGFRGNDDVDFYGLFDGHAGVAAAAYAANHYPRILAERLDKEGDDPDTILRLMNEAYADTNEIMKPYLTKGNSSIKHCGSTAVAVLVKDRVAYTSNVGDSRAVLCRGGQAIRLSFDHKPYDYDEEDRINALGGFVAGETGRVNGVLAVSRSVGDFFMHPYVVCDAFVDKIDLCDEDEFLILACDGVWDEISDQMSVDIVRERIHATEDGTTIASCALRDYAYLLESDDNISVIVVDFKKKPLGVE